ncbi:MULTISPECIES: GNAT family N-acetyltransferase [Phenylobacterium]|uniref:RimJ/RimL family protein N-acetyltransferase n=1 Tax=Phenylobacterium koreense TaxID=266125 RepID=A0ABV2EHQ9_9CAUL
MHIRRATSQDALDVLRWRNDPLTRSMSRDGSMIEEPAHLAWFVRAAEDPRRVLLIAEAEGQKLGMVRFDEDGGRWEANINLAPEARGRGLAVPILKRALELFGQAQPATAVEAEIKPQNAASIRIFEAAGFQPQPSDGALLRYLWPGA